MKVDESGDVAIIGQQMALEATQNFKHGNVATARFKQASNLHVTMETGWKWMEVDGSG